jgi:hypothetical protein
MSQFSNFTENQIADHYFRAASASKPTNLAVALLTVAPNDAGGGTEVVGGSYTRATIAPSNTNFTATQGGTSGASSGTGGVTSNAVAITFPPPSGNWGEIVAFQVRDNADNIIAWDFLRPTSASAFGAVGIASTDVFTCPNHNFGNTDRVILRPIEDGALPVGVSADTIYFVISSAAGSFQLSLTSGGAAINLTADGSCGVYKILPIIVNSGNPAPSFPIGNFSATIG